MYNRTEHLAWRHDPSLCEWLDDGSSLGVRNETSQFKPGSFSPLVFLASYGDALDDLNYAISTT